jgi:hypothetical protein
MIRPEQYEQSKDISQSDLKLMETNIQEFYKRKILGEMKTEEEKRRERKRYFDVGDLTETMYLQPELKSEFYCMENITLGDKFKLLMDNLLAMANESEGEEGTVSPDVTDYLVFVEQAAKDALYYYNPEKADRPWSRTIETIVNEVKTTGAIYFRANIEAKGKIVVNVQDWNTGAQCLEKITTSNNKQIALIVDYVESARAGNEDIELIIGVPLYGTFQGVRVKVLYDLAIIHKKEKWIWPLDLKTTSNILGWASTYRKLKYGRQGALYSNVIHQNYPDYTLKNFGFIVVGTDPNKDDRAEYFEMSSKEMHAQTYGVIEDGQVVVRGLTQSFADYQWHMETNIWNRYPVHAANDDVYVLETFGKREIDETPPEEEEIF